MVLAVLFDLDGVLVDSEAISTEASDKILNGYGIIQTEQERMKVFGRRTIDNFSDAINARKLDIDPKKLVEEKIMLFNELIIGRLKPREGVVELLDKIVDAGHLMAVVSSGPLDKVNASLKEAGLFEYFKVIVSGDCCKKGKPNPEPFLLGASILGVEPVDCVVIEDAQAGLDAAKAAGMRSIAVRSPHTFGQDLSGADLLVSSMMELDMDIIKGIYDGL